MVEVRAQHADVQFSFFEPRPKKSPISLTPLIDVVFILLVFFMLASSFQQYKAVEIVSNVTTGNVTDDTDQLLILQLTEDGYFLGGDRVEADEFEERLEASLTALQTSALIIEVDRTIDLQGLVFVLDAAKRAGASTTSLVSSDMEASGLED